jgi:pimeloyl-ACP methyl ester carboxylesterase
MRRILALAALAVVLSACAAPPQQPAVLATPPPTVVRATLAPATAQPAETTPPVPTAVLPRGVYERADCRFSVPAGANVECGYLSVPLRHELPGGPRIKLHVAVYQSRSPEPEPDPVVYLEGGPGGEALLLTALGFGQRIAPFLEQRDFVVFDQRGTGFSEPPLDCPELAELDYDMLGEDVRIPDALARYNRAALACRERLGAQGIDFGAINSVQSAGDLAALRTALGYDEWNLYGISYGTRLALSTMRLYPQGIRSVILDSTVPLQSAEADTPVSVARGYQALWDGCAADTRCQSAYPNLEQDFYALVERLNQQPVTVQTADPLTGRNYAVVLNGDRLFDAVTQALYSSGVIPTLPLAITAAARGADYSLLARAKMLQVITWQFVSEGMFYAVRCNEEIAFEDPATLAAADDAFPQFRGAYDQGFYVELCDAWDAGKAPPEENQPLRSDLPTLVLAGEYDPVTPPEHGREAAATLSRSFFYEFPGGAHGVSADGGCPLDVALSFLADPTTAPDTSCIAEMPGTQFVVPSATLVLEPFVAASVGIRGVRPAGWREQTTGVFAPPRGDLALKQAQIAAAPDSVVRSVLGDLGLQQLPQATEQRQANGRNWSIYRIDDVGGYPLELAVAPTGESTLLVMLASRTTERQLLYDEVFLPALASLELAG